MREEYRVFQIDKQDTVATALQGYSKGSGYILSGTVRNTVLLRQPIFCQSQGRWHWKSYQGRKFSNTGCALEESHCIYSPRKLGFFI